MAMLKLIHKDSVSKQRLKWNKKKGKKGKEAIPDMKGTFSPSAKFCYISNSKTNKQKNCLLSLLFLLKESISWAHFATLL